MPRVPQQARARATVDAIIEAGFLSLARHGRDGTTTTHIADIAGIGVGSLYEYFSNKDAIFEAMQQRFMADFVAHLQPQTAVIARLDVPDAIHTILTEVQVLLARDDQRYLRYARGMLGADLKLDMTPVTRFLGDLIVQYVMQHPQLIGMRRFAAMSYIFVNAGMLTVIRHLSDPNPPVSYEELVDGLAHMVSHYVLMEQQLLGTGQSAK